MMTVKLLEDNFNVVLDAFKAYFYEYTGKQFDNLPVEIKVMFVFILKNTSQQNLILNQFIESHKI